MTISSQQYAGLANDSYEDRVVGRRAPGDRETVEIDGVQFQVLEHANNQHTGYQGTIYQRVDTGEVVVAHRGTEQIYRDGVLTDGAMVFDRANPQAADAIELTRHARQFAREQLVDLGREPPVTVTGHSLGGSLAQISAHHFGLKGETFNAYGAASLGFRIPEGGNAMVNHVMATDVVSAASGHYGQVRTYAARDEIVRLDAGGFSNSRLNGLIPDRPVLVATHSLGAHMMHNFLDKDANGLPDVSVLRDPQTLARAEQNQRMIEEYRDDWRTIRATATVLSRNPFEQLKDAYDDVRGPLAPGEPARREPVSRDRSSVTPRLDDPQHAGFPLYAGAERGVHEHDAKAGRTPDAHSGQLAAALAAEMHRAGGTHIDSVVMSQDASRTFAVQGRVDDPARLLVSVDTTRAMNTSLEESTRRIAEAPQQQTALAQQTAPVQDQQHEARARAMG